MRIAFSLHLFLAKVNCKYYHDGCMVTGVRSTMEEHEERFHNNDNNYDDNTDNYKLIKCKSQFDPRCRRGSVLNMDVDTFSVKKANFSITVQCCVIYLSGISVNIQISKLDLWLTEIRCGCREVPCPNSECHSKLQLRFWRNLSTLNKTQANLHYSNFRKYAHTSFLP